MLAELPDDQVRRILEGVAGDILAEANVGEPPVDATLLAERLGIVVARDIATEPRARFVRLGGSAPRGQGTILVADDLRPERIQWAVAHEVGECAAHRV